MPRSRLNAVHASSAVVAVQGTRPKARRCLLSDVMAPVTSPPMSFTSASINRISQPLERLIGASFLANLVSKCQVTCLPATAPSPTGYLESELHETRGSFVFV